MSQLRHACRITGAQFDIPAGEKELLARLGELHPGIRSPLPPPTVHPLESLRQNFAWGNIDQLHRSKSALSGRPLLTRYNPELGCRTVTLDEFWTDAVDNREHGRAYDFSRPFFEQFDELLHDVLMLPLNMSGCEGSDYVNGAERAQNCYLCFSVIESEDCLYCTGVYNGTDNIYCVGSNRDQFCYSCVDTNSCYACRHCQECANCSECIGCWDCIGCKNCFGCVGLQNASYHIYNQPHSKEEYFNRLEEMALHRRSSMNAALERCRSFFEGRKHTVNRITASENCTGFYIRNSKNLHYCTHAAGAQDCGYMVNCLHGSDCWRGVSFNSELSYQSTAIRSYHTVNCYSVFNAEFVLYSHMLFNRSAHCFGCASLKNNSYCILNKQYSKSGYFDMLPRIISHMKSTGEWAEFFPPAISPHTYDEAWHTGYFAEISEDEQRKRGYRVRSGGGGEQAAAGVIPGSELPDDITGLDTSEALQWVVACESTGAAFKFQAKELQFYLKHRIPLPTEHWRQRLHTLLRMRQVVPDVSEFDSPID